MTSGRLALAFGAVFIGLIALQLSGVAANWNASLYTVLSSISTAEDGFFIRRMAGLVTKLGDTYFSVALACLVLFWGWSVRSLPVARNFTIAMIFVGGLNALLKVLIAAPRPESGQWMESLSFPSGHASAGVAAWTMLALMAILGFRRFPVKVFFAVLLFGLGIAIAFSRVVIGVHWPLDILAGTFEGLFVAAVFYRSLYQGADATIITTHDPQLLLGMTAVMAAIYMFL